MGEEAGRCAHRRRPRRQRPPFGARGYARSVRPLRSLAIWLADEGLVARNPFRRTHGRAAGSALLPSADTPTKSATLDDLRTLERGCAGDAPLDLRDRAIVSILITTAARNSSVRLLATLDVDLARDVIRFRRAKGGKTLEVALQPSAAAALHDYLEHGRAAIGGAGDDREYLFPAHHGRGARCR